MPHPPCAPSLVPSCFLPLIPPPALPRPLPRPVVPHPASSLQHILCHHSFFSRSSYRRSR
eukprot:530364-Rhodomonas_salina.1